MLGGKAFHRCNTPEPARGDPALFAAFVLAGPALPGLRLADRPRRPQIVPPALAIGALLALTAWSAYRWPAWGFLGGWFFLILAPTSSMAPIEDLAFEHRMYLPLAAVVALVVMAGYHAWQHLLGRSPSAQASRPAVRWLATILLVAVATALGCRTVWRNEDYRSDRAIWEATLRQRPNSVRALDALAHALIAEGENERALALLNRAIDLSPDFAGPYNNRGNAYQNLNDPERAIEDYNRAIALKPRDFAPYNNRGNALGSLGHYDEAVEDFSKAIELADDSAQAYNNRGTAYYRLEKVRSGDQGP